ncbi:MAG: MMPL family transporter [Solirubrobacteraceae bacterium]
MISRIREHWLDGVGNHASVALGLSQTARVISSAALIMASVLFAFLPSSSVVVKMLAPGLGLGLGLGASVILDATVIRLLIVPSLMFVFDAANWWAPAWLDRLLPRLEPAPVPPIAAPSPAPVPAPLVTPSPAPVAEPTPAPRG